MNCLNAGFASLNQCARVAIVAYHHRNPPRYPPSGERIEQTLKRRSLVRGENSKVHGSYLYCLSAGRSRFTRGRPMIAPAAVGCKRLSVRIVRELRHGDEAVGGTELDAVIVRTEVLDVAEAVSQR